MMKIEKYICDHCGVEFNALNGYSDMEIADLDFENHEKVIDLCTECYQGLCDIVREYVNKPNKE